MVTSFLIVSPTFSSQLYNQFVNMNEKREKDKLTYRERGAELQRILNRRLVKLPGNQFSRPTNALPFHLPHKRVLYFENEEAKRELESYKLLFDHNITDVKQLLDGPDENITAIDSSEVQSVSKNIVALSASQEKLNALTARYGSILRLPPVETKKKFKAKSASVSLYNLDNLKGEVDLDMLFKYFRENKTHHFFYMVHTLTPDSVNYTHYSYTVLPYQQVNIFDFFILGNEGLIHILQGRPTFTPMDELEVDYRNFCNMRSRKFFKHFLLYKIFNVWHRNIRWRKWHFQREDLEGILLYGHDELRKAMYAVQSVCNPLSHLSFFDTYSVEKLPLDVFVHTQNHQRMKIIKKLQESRLIMREILNNACHGDLMSVGFTTDDADREVPPEIMGTAKMLGVETTKDGLYRMTFLDRANKKKRCVRISRFIVMLDYIIQTMLHTLLHTSLLSVLSAFERHTAYMLPRDKYDGAEVDEIIEGPRESKVKNPMFLVSLQPGKKDVNEFQPSAHKWINTFKTIIDSWISFLESLETFCADKYFDPFTQPFIAGQREARLVGNGTSLHPVLQNDTNYHFEKNKIFNVLHNNLNILTAYIQRFNSFGVFYKKNVKLDPDVIMNESGLDKFRHLLIDYKAKVDTGRKIADFQNVGLFQLLLEDYTTGTTPIMDRYLRLVENTIPRVGREKCKEFTDETDAALEYLATEPKTTENYVEYLDFLDKCFVRGEELDNWLEYLKDLYEMCEEFEVPVPPEDIEDYYVFGDKLASLHTNVESLLAEKDKIIDKFNNQIAKDIRLLMESLIDIRKEIMDPFLLDLEADPIDVEFILAEIYEKLQEKVRLSNTFKGYQKACKVEVFRFDILDDLVQEVKLRQMLWENRAQWDETVEEWLNCNFEELNPEDMQQTIAKFLKNINLYEKKFPPNEIVPVLKKKVEEYREKLPIITSLRNPDLKQRHWILIEQILNCKFYPEEPLTLNLLESHGIYYVPTEINDISGQASSEAGLEGLLKKVEDAWKALEFVVVPHKDSKDVFILAGIEEIQLALDDTHINLSTIASSRNVGPIKPRVDDWIKNINLFATTLDEWLNCQTNWLYLQPIFSAPDIQRQLPKEAKLFVSVDKSWKSIMRATAKTPLALQACTAPGLLEQFQKNNKLLDEILKCLEAYLESKRVIFPRFYFLSNEELLEILAQTRNPHAVQPHLRKCFDAISKLNFGWKSILPDGTEIYSDVAATASEDMEVVQTTDIISMVSPEGEVVGLTKGLKARGNVEDWLGKVEEAMFSSLHRLMRDSLEDYTTKPRIKWVLCHSSQITLTVSQIMWAKDVHLILSPSRENILADVATFEKKCYSDLNNLAAMVRGQLAKLNRITLCSLITIDVHARDIISGLVRLGIDSSNNFEWVKQLRYYWDTGINNCIACMASARHVYGFEYLGASPRLVITPLTDKCYLCLMGALQLDLGGAPAGPAGTGKTETTKDLAKSLAIQCVVFNCSEGLDYKMMGRFFSGLAQSGAWCCFDEFNRIDIEVLSVIAQQLITIRNAKAAKQSRFMFEGREIKLVPQCATFITMNPGYAGRTELPDNLKSVFRPFAMMVPDYGLIAEVILYSEGFESSKALAQKMVNMYKLCSEQLSQQDHYDFGMRAVKSVLVMAGSLKRENPDKREDIVLIRALRDSNLPKFLADDAVLFQGILNDLFPGVVLPEHDYGVFQKAMEVVVVNRGLQPEPITFLKTIQLHETMVVRWGVMTVGPTGGGKTAVLNVLKDTLTKLFEDEVEGLYYRPVTVYTLNPKSVTMGELYGEVNLLSMEWKDGLLGIFVRIAVQCTEERHQWVVCDGPVDAVWIENMNTVLDDNKMLCLANSERIKLTQWVHMLFEVQDLAQASPATVSRCGMVYIDPDDLRWLPYVKTWACRLLHEGTISQTMHDVILANFEKFLEEGLDMVKKKCLFGIKQVEISKVVMLCSLMQNCLKSLSSMGKYMDMSSSKTQLLQIFIFAYIWSIGGNLEDKSREVFEHFVRELFEDIQEARLPYGKELWDVFFSASTRNLEPWSSITPTFKYDPNVQFFDMLVPTNDTVRFGYIMNILLEEGHPVFFTGSTGVGKSVVAKSVLNAMAESGKWIPNTLNFSAQTSSMRTQEMIEGKMEKKRRTIMGAPAGKRVVVFVDDVNMPKLETYGAQAPIELLRQFLDFKGMYDREKLFWKEFRDMVLCCAAAPPGGGRNPLTPRFMRHFGMLQIPAPSEGALKVIFKSIVQGFLADFSTDIFDVGETIVLAAIDLYEKIAEDLLPTPAKSHYVFNLRDLSKCVQGILQADSGTMRERKNMIRLFFHECLRVFHDRLIDVEDKSYFWLLLRDICSKWFSDSVVTLPESGLIKEPPTLLFGDFMNQAAEKEDRIYEEIKEVDKLKSIFQDVLVDYNLTKSTNMKIIFFMDAVEHICRLARILRAQRGNGLLVGVGGMGKQSLTRLSSHINYCNCFQVVLTRSYDYNSFHEDLRSLYFSAGALNHDMVFLFTDTQIVMEEFLEDINNILNSGEVPNLFEGDELEKCIIACRPAAKQAGIPEQSRDGIFDFFISRVRSRLHVVLCMSPVGDDFRRRCRMFPSLVNCCTIDWFMPWPKEALISVAEDSLEQVVDQEIVENMSYICYTMHSSVESMTHRFFEEMRRHYYVTPSSYLDLLKLYQTMLENRKEQLNGLRERINNGLLKLFETNDVVAIMKVQLVKLEPQLAEKNAKTAELMKSIVSEKAGADEVRKYVIVDEAAAKEKADECQALKDDAQADLDLALPYLDAANKALEALNKSDINEVKVFIKPPFLVRFVMQAVCLLLGAKQDWPSAKLVLGDQNFLKKLQDYDKDHIPDSMLKKLKVFIEDPQFVPELIATTSKACKSLCIWVRAIDTYAKVFRVVEPKKQKVEGAEKELSAIMAILREKQEKLADVEAQIAKLEANYDASLREKAKLEATLNLCSARLNRAGRLTSALSDEQERWEQGVEALGVELSNVVGDVLVAAACVAYLGAFTSDYREELTELWISKIIQYKIPASEAFSLIAVLADPYEIRIWNTCGLPRDKVSTENGIYVTKASRWPLMIDPQEQANRWIRQMEAMNNLQMIKMTDANFMRILESSIRLGYPVLLWEVGEQLDPTLRPILAKAVFKQSGRLLIRLGDSDIEYDPNFKLYITTKMSNPHYLPEICIQVTLVNFTVTPSGLEDQLLGDVVRIERPDLESVRTELIIRINRDKGQLKAIEDKILKMLFHSKGNILDDEELVETLNESKETSSVITARLEEAELTEAKISEAREGYRPVAERGSCLYFVVAQLAEIDPMYQFSLKYFNLVFNNVIESSPPSKDLNVRLRTLMDDITLAIYNNVSRGLFERHKLVYSFMLCVSILIKANKVKQSHWNFLLRGSVGTVTSNLKKPTNAVLTDVGWQCCLFLEGLDHKFKGLATSVTTIVNVVVGDFSLDINLVGRGAKAGKINWNERFDLFERMMIIKALKEEKLIFAITEYVRVMLGQPFIESPLISLHILFADTSNITPLVFVLSTGCDPVGAFLRFAAETNNTDRINSISLGQGQGPIAQNLIEKGVKKGDWVFLQNCHLASSWMLAMEEIIMKIADEADETHQDFRLFLSSMPSNTFPVSVLQNSVKVTNEPPKGLRSNMKRAFAEIHEDFFSDHPLGSKWRKMIFGICFFHAVILERKKFGPLGWNILYEFSDSDRECALLNLNLFCPKQVSGLIPWDALEYITGEITYGGRVTDFWDQRTLKTILKGFFSPMTLETDYKYSVSGTYYCPETKKSYKIEHYRDFIEHLPLIEEPEIFGMHENANIAFQTKETASVIVTIMSVQIKGSGGGQGKSSDQIVKELAMEIQNRINTKINTEEVHYMHRARDEKGRVSSLTTVLFQEIDRFNKMLRVMHNSLVDLQKAIKGFVVMSEALEEVYKAFMSNMIPKMWSASSYPSLKYLGSWTRDLELRLDFIDVWVRSGSPLSFWLSGFFFPQGFMTGVLQTYARKYDFPIDELKIDFSVKNVVLSQEEIESYHDQHEGRDHPEAYRNVPLPRDGVLVHGLFLDAARFDRNRMMLADPRPGELNPPLPVMALVPSGATPSRLNRYECPMYKTSVRAGVLSTTGHSTNFVIAVLLPTDQPESYWILKGTALLTQLTD